MNTKEIEFKLTQAVTAYDRKASQRKGWNPYALGQYLARIQEIVADIGNGATPRRAILAAFSDRLADVCLKSIGESESSRAESLSTAWHYVPDAK